MSGRVLAKDLAAFGKTIFHTLIRTEYNFSLFIYSAKSIWLFVAVFRSLGENLISEIDKDSFVGLDSLRYLYAFIIYFLQIKKTINL